ncbi:MAG: hypothetical protein L6Q37_01950 [Bdellovibrionaceae bacterium]|nr:hypothetical protein [Pseudobdellovibrionaceae bacterium]
MSLKKWNLKFIFLLTFSICVCNAQSKKKVLRKVQEVNFSEMSIKGTIRNPDGAFLVQKKGIKFRQKNTRSKLLREIKYENSYC